MLLLLPRYYALRLMICQRVVDMLRARVMMRVMLFADAVYAAVECYARKDTLLKCVVCALFTMSAIRAWYMRAIVVSAEVDMKRAMILRVAFASAGDARQARAV